MKEDEQNLPYQLDAKKVVCNNCESVSGFYLGITCHKCGRSFRSVNCNDMFFNNLKQINMYYKEEWINGRLFWKATPDGEWIEFTKQQYIERCLKLEGELKSLSSGDVSCNYVQSE